MILTWFKGLTLLVRAALVVGTVIAIGGGVWGVYAWIEGHGYDRGYAAASAKCEADRAKQQKANDEAIDAANQELHRLADQLSMQLAEKDNAVAAVDQAVGSDPHAADSCLDASGVQRLNAIR